MAKKTRAKRPLVERFMSKIKEENGCWIWTGYKDQAGYGRFSMNFKPVFAHRLAFELGVGDIPEGMNVCHSCDRPSCCNPDHLFLGTQKDNIQDSIKKGRFKIIQMPAEEKAHKLDPETACWIRLLYKYPYKWGKGKKLAKIFGVSNITISRVVHNKAWKNLH